MANLANGILEPMSGLPSGTVTFLFSDIEGSTNLLKVLGDAYGDVLSDHRRLMRTSFSERGGVEIDTQGDAFFFAFPRARDAVAAAVEGQRLHVSHEWPHGHPVRVRMGLHTGEPALSTEGYLGMDVVRAARLCTVGHGGQVLLSETTRALVGNSLPEGVLVHTLGERRLKGIDEPERVFELEIDGAPSPATTQTSAPASEPAPLSSKRGMDDFGARLASKIEGYVRRKVEEPLERALSDVDTLADRAAEHPETITDKLESE